MTRHCIQISNDAQTKISTIIKFQNFVKLCNTICNIKHRKKTESNIQRGKNIKSGERCDIKSKLETLSCTFITFQAEILRGIKTSQASSEIYLLFFVNR